MKLRARLILAFLVLSVLPLAGMTVYGYRSSISAFRHAVEAEAAATTAEMSGRMESVTADLSARMKRLDVLPYEALLAQGPDSSADDPTAERFVRVLKSRMGDAAPLIERLKYTPLLRRRPTPAAPPAPGAPPVPAAPAVLGDAEGPSLQAWEAATQEPFVIHLNRLLFEDDGDASDGGPRVIRNGQDWLVLPGELKEVTTRVLPGIIDTIRAFVDDKDLEAVSSQIAETLREAEGAAADGQQAQQAQHAQALEHAAQLELRGTELAQKARVAFEESTTGFDFDFGKLEQNWNGDPEEFRRRMSEAGFGVAIKQLAETVGSQAQHFTFAHKFEVEQDGQKVGRVEAQLNVREVLHSVLSETRADQGEIPFAVAADGSVLTPDDADRIELERLGLGTLAQAGETAQPTQVGDNWIVQTRRVPELDLIFGIARPVGESLEHIRRTAGRNMGLGLGLILIAMLGIIPLSGRMTHNLSRLTHGAEQLAQGNLGIRVPVRSSDEFGALARTFNRLGADLQEKQRQLVHQERLKKELEMCRQIQDEMLPHGRLSFPFAEVRAVSIPARELGGDFFNYFALPNGDVALLMGDVSGKGVPAALMMANLQAMLKARLPLEPDLARLATLLDSEIEASTPHETYVTLFMAVIDAQRQVLRYVNAGHNTQYLVNREVGTRRLVSSGRPPGLVSGGGYTQEECPLAPGDLLFLFTDGLTEAEDESGVHFGVERLEQLLASEQGNQPDAILERVESAIRQYRGRAEPSDDATMLVLRYDPSVTQAPVQPA